MATLSAPCPLCHRENNVTLIAASGDAEAPFDVFECSACGIVFDELGRTGPKAGTPKTTTKAQP